MIAIYPDEGLLEIQDQMLSDDMILHLYVNNLTPTKETILANLTEAAWMGYASALIAFADWLAKGISDHNGYALAVPRGFLNTSGAAQSAYGYYLTNADETILRQVVRFDSAPLVRPDGQTFVVIPTWGDFSQSG